MAGATSESRWKSVYASAYAKFGSEERARVIANAVAFKLPAPRAAETVDAFYFSAQLPFAPKHDEVTCPECMSKKPCDKLGLAKPVLPAGCYKHPGTGKMMEFPAAELEAIAAESNKYIKNGNQCSFPNEHDGKPDENLGWWAAKFFVADAPDPRDPRMSVPWIWGKVKPTALAATQIASGAIKYISPAIRGGWEDSLGNKYGRHIYHVAATMYPVIPGQGGFERVELSVGDTRRVFAINSFQLQGESRMFSKKIALALGLPEGASEDECLSAIAVAPKEDEKLSAAIGSLEKANKSLQESLSAEKKQRRSEYLSTVVQRATDFGAPLEAEKVKQIEELLDADQEKAARTVAASFLSVAEKFGTKRGAKVPHTEGDVGKGKAATDADNKKRQDNELLSSKKQLEALGFKVKVESGEVVVLSAPGDSE